MRHPGRHPHHCSSLDRRLARVRLDADNSTVGEPDDPVGHTGDGRIVRDDDGGGAELAVHTVERVKHDHAGGDIERPGGLVAEEDVGPLCDRSRDCDPLLLTPGELRREVIEPMARPTSAERLFRRHRLLDDLGDQRHVLAGRQAGNQVVELKDETDVRPAVVGERRLVGASSGSARRT